MRERQYEGRTVLDPASMGVLRVAGRKAGKKSEDELIEDWLRDQYVAPLDGPGIALPKLPRSLLSFDRAPFKFDELQLQVLRSPVRSVSTDPTEWKDFPPRVVTLDPQTGFVIKQERIPLRRRLRIWGFRLLRWKVQVYKFFDWDLPDLPPRAQAIPPDAAIARHAQAK